MPSSSTTEHRGRRRFASVTTAVGLCLLSCGALTGTARAYTQAELDNGDVIVLEDFGADPTKNWYAKNDPVMGGRSTATVEVSGGLGRFNGEVVDVPSLSAPGFVTMEAEDAGFPDVSQCEGLEIFAKAATSYDGYRISFGHDRADTMRFGSGYKAPFTVGADFQETRVSFAAFSDNWNEATGEVRVECKDKPEFCPTMKTLQNLEILTLWAEGVNGVVDLEVKSISAYDCKTDNGGDLFKTIIEVFGNEGPASTAVNTPAATPSSPTTTNNNNKDTQEATEQSILAGQIAVPLSVVALVASLCSLFFVLKTNMNQKLPEQPVLQPKGDPDDQIL